MKFFRLLLGGMVSVFTLGSSPLYRYPYRNEAEGLSGDLQRLGKDIANTLDWDDEEHV